MAFAHQCSISMQCGTNCRLKQVNPKWRLLNMQAKMQAKKTNTISLGLDLGVLFHCSRNRSAENFLVNKQISKIHVPGLGALIFINVSTSLSRYTLHVKLLLLTQPQSFKGYNCASEILYTSFPKEIYYTNYFFLGFICSWEIELNSLLIAFLIYPLIWFNYNFFSHSDFKSLKLIFFSKFNILNCYLTTQAVNL